MRGLEVLKDLLNVLLYDTSPGERLRMARVTYRAAVAVFLVWSIGFFAPVGYGGFARGDEVDEKIKAAVDPVKAQLEEIKAKELAAIKTQLDTSARTQRKILSAQLSSQLRDLNRLRCTASDAAVRGRMENEIEESEMEYQQLTGDRYPLPACKDL
jgi:hypothetical protein